MGKPFVVNLIALGALTRLMPEIHPPSIEEEIKNTFPASIAIANLIAYRVGYEILDEELMNWDTERDSVTPDSHSRI